MLDSSLMLKTQRMHRKRDIPSRRSDDAFAEEQLSDYLCERKLPPRDLLFADYNAQIL